MEEKHFQVIQEAHENRGEDYTELFQAITSVADEVGLDEALRHLQRCEIREVLSWLNEKFDNLDKTGNPIADAYTLFYEKHLDLSTPEHGEIVERNEERIVTKWWSPCPILEACQKFGLDTKEVCRKAYHQPAQVFLSHIDPRLRFDRNYDHLRPHGEYCEEMITLEESNTERR
jgi:hypothetical protein